MIARGRGERYGDGEEQEAERPTFRKVWTDVGYQYNINDRPMSQPQVCEKYDKMQVDELPYGIRGHVGMREMRSAEEYLRGLGLEVLIVIHEHGVAMILHRLFRGPRETVMI